MKTSGASMCITMWTAKAVNAIIKEKAFYRTLTG